MTVALGATPVAAGVVGIVLLTAVITRPQMSAQGLGPAVDNLIHSAAMAGQEIRAKPLLIGGTIVPEDVRHLWHARAPERLEVGREGVDGGVHDAEEAQPRGGVTLVRVQRCNILIPRARQAPDGDQSGGRPPTDIRRITRRCFLAPPLPRPDGDHTSCRPQKVATNS
jgi:hypothetical protein